MKKRRLLLLLLVFPISCAILLGLEAWVLVVSYLGAAAVGFGLEALVLYQSRGGQAWLRLIPLVLLAFPLALAWLDLNSADFLAGLGAAMCLVGALCYLCGWGAAWALAPDKEEKEEKHHEA